MSEAKPELNEHNSFWEECPHCEEGYWYDCIDGFCEDAEFGCDDCANRCDVCRGKGGWRVPFGSKHED